MTARFEVSVDSLLAGDSAARASEVRVDAESARQLELFMERLPADASGDVTRPVVAWRGDVRMIIDVTISRPRTGVWQLRLGPERDATAAPDVVAPVDPRLDDLATMVWVTDAERLARWFNRSWLEFVGADLASELGWGWMRHLHPDDLYGLLEVYESAQQDVHGFEHVARVSDAAGAYSLVRVRATPRIVGDAFAGFTGVCGVVEEPEPGNVHRSSVVDLLPLEDEDSPERAVARLAVLDSALEVSRPADTVEAGLLRRIVSAWIAQHEHLQVRGDEIVLAVHEAVTNSVRHAYRGTRGRVRLGCELRAGRAEFRIRDWGAWQAPNPEIAHRGIQLMQGLADDVAIEHLPDGTEIGLWFRV